MYRVVVGANGTLYGAAASVHDLYQSTYLTDARIDGGNGAVLFSTNKGVTWQTLHDYGRVVSWVAVDPTNPNRLYASVVHSSPTVGGIYVTNNLSAGAASTWTKLANPPRTEGHPFNIVVLNDGSIVASYSGRRTSNFTASSGVFVSTDGGQSWADRSAPGMLYWTKDVVVDPHDPSQNTWYAGVYSGWGGQANGLGGLYRTTNRGQSWTRVSSGLDRVESITFNPADQNEAFVTTEVQGLWHSSNIRSATPTFTQVDSYPFRQPERVFFNPHNLNEIWVTSFGNGIRVGTVATPPTVEAVQVNDGAVQRSTVRSMTVTFSGPVTFVGGNANAAAAFALTRLTNGGGIVGLNAAVATDGQGRTVVTLTFQPGGATDPVSILNGGAPSLADGRYRLDILSASVSGSGGLALDGDNNGTAGGNFQSAPDTAPGVGPGLYRLFGDATGNGVVDLADLGALRSTFNAGIGDPAYLGYLDSDNSGTVDLLDLSEFRSRFNASVF
jgi:hypothetical protein